MTKTFVYVGSWGHMGGVDGIAAYDFNTQNGELELIEQVTDSIRVGSTCVDEERGLYYVTDERSNHPNFGNQGGGGNIVVYSVDKASGKMTEKSRQYSYGPQPSFIDIDLSKSSISCLCLSRCSMLGRYLALMRVLLVGHCWMSKRVVCRLRYLRPLQR